MIQRPVVLRENTEVTPCPRCGNNRYFTVKADYCAEDLCETWVVCKCGFDPTEHHTDYRYENVWGEVGKTATLYALEGWNEVLAEENVNAH